jgi:hypothetical protein
VVKREDCTYYQDVQPSYWYMTVPVYENYDIRDFHLHYRALPVLRIMVPRVQGSGRELDGEEDQGF